MDKMAKKPKTINQHIQNIKLISKKLEMQSRGLYGKYHIQKNTPNGLEPVDKGAEYFVLRLDNSADNDLEHIKACRIGIHAYAAAIKHHLPKLSEELKERYPLI